MAGLVELLGEKLLSKSGDVKTAEALAGKEAVALYFSGHWCPPCRGFTPKLGEWYSKDLKAKGLEVVFVSSDKDEGAFNEYFGEQPWLALGYSDRERKETLSKKFKVQGIPTVVILDAGGQVITKDGREAISSDPTGADFPWKPKTLSEILDGAKLLSKEGEVTANALAGKVYGFYFSAHWCPPCRGFTPQLAEWYSKDLKAKGLEVVFVSSDKDEGAFKEYFGEQPWLALDYADRKRKEQLSNLFGVRGIPSFVIIDKDGSIITKEGRAAVSSDPTGAEFPWYPKPVLNLSQGPGSINEVPMVIAFCESCDVATKTAVEVAMTPIGKRYADEAKARGDEEPKFAFAVATESGGITDKIRGLISMPSSPSSEPQLMLMDIPDNGGFYEGPAGVITTEKVEAFLADYESKKLERKQLQ